MGCAPETFHLHRQPAQGRGVYTRAPTRALPHANDQEDLPRTGGCAA